MPNAVLSPPRHLAGLRRRAWLRPVGALTALAVLLATAVLARAYVFPPSDEPQDTDLVMVLGGLGTNSRIARAGEVVAEHPGATIMVIVGEMKYCPDQPPGAADLVCVLPPDPSTTQGEARMAADYAREHGMRSITVVTTPDQLVRAELRFARCWPAEDLVMVEAPAPLLRVVGQVPYQAAATVKALVLEREC